MSIKRFISLATAVLLALAAFPAAAQRSDAPQPATLYSPSVTVSPSLYPTLTPDPLTGELPVLLSLSDTMVIPDLAAQPDATGITETADTAVPAAETPQPETAETPQTEAAALGEATDAPATPAETPAPPTDTSVPESSLDDLLAELGQAELPADGRVTIEMLAPAALHLGDTVTLVATLTGYDGLSLNLQWQYTADGANWHDVDGANGLRYTFTVNEQTAGTGWRMLVTAA